MLNKSIDDVRIAIIGLGYVGLPLAVEFSKKRPVVGFDISEARIAELNSGKDSSHEMSPEELAQAQHLSYSSDLASLEDCDTYIITVPTPIDEHKRPDLRALVGASSTVGKVLKPGNVVVYESTVYPGATEEVCVPVLERISGLKFNENFFVGYSSERINPGDKRHRLTDIVKVTSGSTEETADYVNELYASIIAAGTYKAESIRVAEAAKVIENTQRDLNIALINELAIILNRMKIDTESVLEAASTKWNFLPFRPGLVGGHCISVDPYYLTYKAEEIGYHPEVILAGRRVNDSMGTYVASQVVKLLLKKQIPVNGARVLILGLSFKENCSDIRNTRVIDIMRELQEFGATVDVHDPRVDAADARNEYGIDVKHRLEKGSYDGIVLAVAHDEFRQMTVDEIHALGKSKHVLYDVKSVLPRVEVDMRL